MTFYTPPTPEVDRFVKDAHAVTPYLAELNLIQYLAFDPPHPVYCEIGETKQCTCHQKRSHHVGTSRERRVVAWRRTNVKGNANGC